MSISQKSSSMQLFRLMIYKRPLHPELFKLEARRRTTEENYEVETWAVGAGHVVRFEAGGYCLTETVLDSSDHLPETGMLSALPCFGEKEFEADPDLPLGYMTTLQTELLTENLYTSTYKEMRDFALETNALAHEWKDDQGRMNLSVIDAQKYKKEYHVQSYHMIAANGFVLRTQSIFELR